MIVPYLLPRVGVPRGHVGPLCEVILLPARRV
jgi:hypothetical protein